MKKFLASLAVFSVLLLILLFAIQTVIDHKAEGRQFERYGTWNVIAMGGIDADLVIVGHSHAVYNFDCHTLEEELGMTCYNLGLIGYPIGDALTKFQFYLQHNEPPKYVLLTADRAFLSQIHRDTLLQYDQFLEQIDRSEVQQLIKGKAGERWLDRLPTVRYAGYLDHVLKVLTTDTFTDGYRGSAYNYEILDMSKATKTVQPFEPDRAAYLRAITHIERHREQYWQNIPVFYLNSPFSHGRTIPVIEYIEPMLSASGQHILHVDHDLTNDTSLMMNQTHLNRWGAKEYSRRVAEAMTEWL